MAGARLSYRYRYALTVDRDIAMVLGMRPAQDIAEAFKKHIARTEQIDATNRGNATRQVEYDDGGIIISCSECTDDGRCEGCEDQFQDLVA